MNLLWLRRAFLAAVGSLAAVRGAALRGDVWLSRGVSAEAEHRL